MLVYREHQKEYIKDQLGCPLGSKKIIGKSTSCLSYTSGGIRIIMKVMIISSKFTSNIEVCGSWPAPRCPPVALSLPLPYKNDGG